MNLQSVNLGETMSSADLGGSSKYSNENFEDWVEKGSTWTALVRGLLNPKRYEKSVERWAFRRPVYRKGIGLIFPKQDVDVEWQHKQSRRRLRGPRQEFSFLVNRCTDPGIGLTGDRVCGLAKAIIFGLFWCALDVPWKSGGVFYSHSWLYQ